jgi:uncharacterized circularly permuted ATP-grasp superfamily protein/uncharacterized alpha-E superfamily protein
MANPFAMGCGTSALRVADVLSDMGPAKLAERAEIARTLARSLGMIGIQGLNSRGNGPPLFAESFSGMDLFPHVFDEEEWLPLEAAIKQRVRALQAFLRDIYHEARILRESALPVDVVLGDPHFRRECVRLPVAETLHFRVAAFDLAQDSSGQWRICRDQLSIPSGAGILLQTRRLLAQAAPELYTAVRVHPIAQFSTELLETLRSVPVASHQEHIVVLDDSQWGSNEFESAYMARKMGLTLVCSDDLIVRDGSLFYRTIGGLQAVTVLFRYVSGNALDPVAFQGNNGIAGLLSCVRQGSVAVVNAIGCGVGESLALLPYSDRIIRFYLNEEPLLPTVATLRCGDWDQRNQVLASENDFQLLPADLRDGITTSTADLLRETPSRLVAHRRFSLATYPSFTTQECREASRPALLRCFAMISATGIRVLPGGLMLSRSPQTFLEPAPYCAKDVWVAWSEESPHVFVSPPGPLTFDPPARQLGSRVAESLFWMGRYCERAETTARMFGILEDVRVEFADADAERWHPLWDALGRMTGHPPGQLRSNVHPHQSHHAEFVLLDENNPSSLIVSLRCAAQNASALLDYLTPEASSILSRLTSTANHYVSTLTAGGVPPHPIRTLTETVLNQLAAFHGMTARTMVHDLGNRFFYAGTHIERIILTLTTVTQIFGDVRALETSTADDGDLENPLLGALLRMLAVQDAYRRRFQRRAQPEPVCELILRDAQVPASVMFCLERLGRTLRDQTVSCRDGSEGVQRLLSHLQELDLKTQLAPGPWGIALPSRLIEMTQQAKTICDAMTDSFFIHQDRGSSPDRVQRLPEMAV